MPTPPLLAPDPSFSVPRSPRVAKTAVLPLLGLALALTLAACSSATPAASPAKAPAPTGDSITIKNFSFSPSVLTVSPGATVTVTNKDSVTHTLTSETGAFNSGDVSPGATEHFTAPTKAGTYLYRCTIHQYMTATLHVS
jgi:plastocyanin